MPVGERVLQKLCRAPESAGPSGQTYGSVEEARAEITNNFGADAISKYIAGRSVLDFGCGFGHHVKALMDLGAAKVTGVDIQERFLELARTLADGDPRSRIVNGLTEPDWADPAGYDAIISINSMEHIEDPAGWMRRWRELLAPNGRVLVAFGPLWWGPTGAHVGFMTPLPWVQVFFSERTIMSVRKNYRDDGAMRYEDVPGGLNQMTLRKFHKCVNEAGLEVDTIRYNAVKSLPLVTKVPIVREFLTQGLAAVLKSAG